VFRGSHEARVLEAMRSMGVKTPKYDKIERRRIVHLAPDVAGFLAEFLARERKALAQPMAAKAP
jgi:tRNA A-37 threonylcarbamoyl transferase component Bud32